MANELEQAVLHKAQSWLDGNYDAETKARIRINSLDVEGR